MIQTKKFLFILAAVTAALPVTGIAGNEDRSGQAGAYELLINPWARSAGWNGANSANTRGLEASFMNVAGTAFTQKTEFLFSHSYWLKGTDININSFGLTQKLGASSVIGLGLMSMNFGEVEITTPEIPEGGIGKFSPRFMNLGLSYAKAFSSTIFGGLNFKTISEGISNVKATGVALDAGIQYVTGLGKGKDGKKNTDNLKFGIALKNVGPPVHYTGDGLSFKGIVLSTGANLTVEHRSETFELPSLINIGAAYDYKPTDQFRATVAGSFTSNSFSKDAYQGGIELAYMEYTMIRFGYYQEAKAKSTLSDPITTVYTGPSAGVSFNVPLGKGSARTISIDYSVRFTRIFDNVHSIGARINL